MLAEFLAADIVVLGAPMYIFYDPEPAQHPGGPARHSNMGRRERKGLAGRNRVIVAISRGGFYGPGAPTEALEHLETYLHGVSGFIGVTQLEFILIDGIQIALEQRERALASALEAVASLRACKHAQTAVARGSRLRTSNLRCSGPAALHVEQDRDE